MSKETNTNKSDEKTKSKKSKSDKKATSKKEEKKVTDVKTKSKDTKKKKKEVIEEKIVEEENVIIDEQNDDEDFEYDEDLENNYEEETIEKEKKEKEEKISKENIKKIEKKAKEKSKAKKTNNPSKIQDFGYFLEEHRNVISSFIAGVLITILVVIIIWPDRIATLKDGTEPVVKVDGKTYTANDLYDQMKEHYSVSQLLDAIDSDILTKIYPEDDEMKEEVESNADYYINMYQQYYNYTEEQFLSANGFSSYDSYLEYLKLDYRRKKYQDDYVEENLTDKEIQKYYDENVYGDINCQHILIETSSSEDDSSDEDSEKLSDDDAKKLAEEIIDKLNDGTSWEDIQKDYKDKITFEDLGYQSWDSDLEDTFKDALRDMDDKSYSKEPVKTSYGYHVIYRIDQKKAPSLKKTKDTIVKNLVSDKESEDSNLLYKALISLREEKNIDFSDTDMKAKYDSYIKEYK